MEDVSLSCVAKDVTERKAREEQVHLRLREVNHRAKNMLSLVQAIARQTAASEPEDFIGRFSERIQALSANQDLLVRNEWRGVNVEDLVRGQLAPFADLIGSRIDIRGPKLHLKATSAQAIGLALHELATNASKFGALSTDEGRVDVCWGVSGDTFNMSWTERGGRPVSAPKRHGFGTIVIDPMAARSVNGKVQLDYAPSGLIWRLTCPAEGSLEPREPSSIVWDRNTVLKRLSAARRHVETGQGALIVSANSSLRWNIMVTVRKRRDGYLLSSRNFRKFTSLIVPDWKKSLPKFRNEPLPHVFSGFSRCVNGAVDNALCQRFKEVGLARRRLALGRLRTGQG